MAVIDELLVALGYDYDDVGVKDFKKDLNKTVGVIKQFTKYALAGAAAISAFTVASTRASDEQGKLAAELGISVEELDALQFAAQRSGGSAESMARGLQELTMRAGEAARGVGSGVEAFGLLGISVTDTNGRMKGTTQLLREVSGRIQGLDRGTQLELLDKLGLRDSVRLLQAGSAEIANLTAEAKALGVTTAEDAAAAADFQDSLTDILQVTKQLSRLLVRVFAPVLQKINNSLTDWWKRNKELIEQNLPRFIDGVTLAMKIMLATFAAWMGLRILQHIVLMISLFRKLSVASLLSAAGPALMIAALAAIVLALQDIYAYSQGKDSVFGDLIEDFPKLKSAVDAIISVFRGLSDLFDGIIDKWEKLLKLIDEIPEKIEQLKEKVGLNADVEQSYTDRGFKSNFNSFDLEREAARTRFGRGESTTTGGTTGATGTNVERMNIIINGVGDPAAIVQEFERKMVVSARQDLANAVDQ